MSVKIVTQNFGNEEARTVAGYEATGGYQTLKRALRMKPEEIVAEVKAANLRGRGGAGFPCGVKWGFLPKDRKETFLVVNADESEPGTFKDTALMHWDPQRLIEGICISAFAIDAHVAYIYIRGELFDGAEILEKAVEEAYARGYLGKSVAGSSFSLELTVHRGAGAYICGEETGLLNSLEGKRGHPRLKPPFPAVSGAFGKPTIVNNVETLMNVPTIIEKGGQWFADLGIEGDGGTRAIALSGHVNNPGVHEIPVGITLHDIIYSDEYGGGMRGGKKLKAVIPGGSSMPVLTAAEIECQYAGDPMGKDARIKEVEVAPGELFYWGGNRTLRSMPGSGAIIVMDEDTDIVKVAWRTMKFYRHESCGQCTPCREGTGWLEQVSRRVSEGRGKRSDIALLCKTAAGIGGTSICALGDAAAWPMLGFLTKFRDEFEAAIAEAAA